MTEKKNEVELIDQNRATAGDKQEIVNVDGKEYILQHPGYAWYLKAIDNSMARTKSPSQSYLTKEYLKHVVVEPKMSIEDFEEEGFGFAHMMNLIAECERFLTK